MQTKPALRRARSGDEVAVAACVNAAYDRYLDRMDTPPGPMLQDYAHVIADHLVWVLCDRLCDNLRDSEPIVGVLVLIPKDGYLLLDNIALHPDYHGQGLGSRLLAHADSEARHLGYRELRLYTHATMTENVALHQAKGWAVTGRGVEDGYDRIFMCRRLDP